MVAIKHLALCLLFSSTLFSVYKDTFAFYKDTKCVQGHAILMPGCTVDEVKHSQSWLLISYSRDRLNLCNLWKSIVLNKQDSIKLYARKLGVEGMTH